MQSTNGKIIIVGAGPGGLTLALALRQAGFQAAVYERTPCGREAGSGFTIWPNAMRAFDRIGLGRTVRSLSTPLDGIAMSLADGTELFRVDRPAMEARFGGTGWAVLRSELMALLLDRLGEERVRAGTACVGFEQNRSGVTASFEDGSEVAGSALIGADGLRSTIRSRLVGPRQLRYSGYTVWRGIARLKLPAAVGRTSLGRGQQFGIFPMSKSRVYWFASSNAPEGEDDRPSGRKREILARFNSWHTPVRDVIENTDESSILRNDIYDMDPLPTWTVGSVALLGDAAHPSAPDLGQGACQAIEDAVVLASSLQQETDLASSLRVYQSRRIRRTRALAKLSRRIGQTGTWTNPLACWIRNTAIRLTPEPIRMCQLQWMFRFEI